jgi:hypothetical protein
VAGAAGGGRFLDLEPSGDQDQGVGEDWERRRYRLPEPHAEVLLDADHPAHAGAAAYWIGSLAEVLQRIPDLYRTGAGMPYPEYGADVRLAIANFNRPMFVNDLAGWFAALQALRGLLADGGVVIVADEKVAETFNAPGDEIERLNFGFSWWHCLPASRVETPSAAAGTALRPATVRRWAEQAGFAGQRELPVEHLFWRFYELRS